MTKLIDRPLWIEVGTPATLTATNGEQHLEIQKAKSQLAWRVEREMPMCHSCPHYKTDITERIDIDASHYIMKARCAQKFCLRNEEAEKFATAYGLGKTYRTKDIGLPPGMNLTEGVSLWDPVGLTYWTWRGGKWDATGGVMPAVNNDTHVLPAGSVKDVPEGSDEKAW